MREVFTFTYLVMILPTLRCSIWRHRVLGSSTDHSSDSLLYMQKSSFWSGNAQSISNYTSLVRLTAPIKAAESMHCQLLSKIMPHTGLVYTVRHKHRRLLQTWPKLKYQKVVFFIKELNEEHHYSLPDLLQITRGSTWLNKPWVQPSWKTKAYHN